MADLKTCPKFIFRVLLESCLTVSLKPGHGTESVGQRMVGLMRLLSRGDLRMTIT